MITLPLLTAALLLVRLEATFSSSSAAAFSATPPLTPLPIETKAVYVPSFDHDVPLPDSSYAELLVAEDVPVAHALRARYDDVFRDPRQPDSRRFAFDPWHVRCGDGLGGSDAPLPEDEGFGGRSGPSSSGPSSGPAAGERAAAASQVQYSLKRAQCSEFFGGGGGGAGEEEDGDGDDLFADLAEELTALGRTVGLASITPPLDQPLLRR